MRPGYTFKLCSVEFLSNDFIKIHVRTHGLLRLCNIYTLQAAQEVSSCPDLPSKLDTRLLARPWLHVGVGGSTKSKLAPQNLHFCPTLSCWGFQSSEDTSELLYCWWTARCLSLST